MLFRSSILWEMFSNPILNLAFLSILPLLLLLCSSILLLFLFHSAPLFLSCFPLLLLSSTLLLFLLHSSSPPLPPLQASRRSRKGGDSAEASGHMNEAVGSMDVIALCCPKYKDRPQIARVIQKVSTGYSVHWMAGSYSGPWAEAKKRDGRKLVPWVDTIKESDII